jgi:hypothetical protein
MYNNLIARSYPCLTIRVRSWICHERSKKAKEQKVKNYHGYLHKVKDLLTIKEKIFSL